MVIFNADPGHRGRLSRPEQGGRVRRRVQRRKDAISTRSLFMAGDVDLRAAGLGSGNIWFSRTPNIDAVYALARRRRLTGRERIPGLFFNVTTLKDPSLRSDGVHTVEAITAASMDAFAAWRDSPPGHRPAEYHRLKEALTERLLDAVECFVPGLRDRTVLRALGTPLTNAHFLHATRGGIYGTEKTLGNLGPFSFDVTTHIEGLYQCGASTIAPAITGVTNSGLNAAAAALGCDRDDLLTATGQSLRIYPSDDPDACRPSCGRPGVAVGRQAGRILRLTCVA